MLNLYYNLQLFIITCLFWLLALTLQAQCGTSANLIPNHSFETNTCCPTKNGMMTCMNSWVMYQETADYYSDCGTGTPPASGCCGSLPPYPYPDGNTIVGFVCTQGGGFQVRERIGVCLTSPLTSGDSYTFTFYASCRASRTLDYALFGSNNCSDLSPSIGPTAPLPAGYSKLGDGAIALTNATWTKVSLTFTAPSNISAIVFGGDTDPVTPTTESYFYIDSTSLVATSTCPSGGSGTTWTWTGCIDNDWFNPCNWDRLSIPTTASNVIIPFTANQPLITSGTANCFDLTIQSSSGALLTINSSGGGSLNVVKP